MTATSTMFGHTVAWDAAGQVWRYLDDGTLAHHWGGVPRPCPQCNQLPTVEGHDPCIGNIDGVYSACCGHGIENGVILWEALRDAGFAMTIMTIYPIQGYNDVTTAYVIRDHDDRPLAYVFERDDGYRAWLPDAMNAMTHSPCLSGALVDLGISGVLRSHAD